MGGKCRTCGHPERAKIDFLIVSGVPYRRIAPHYGLDEASLRRHASTHLPDDLLRSSKARQVSHASLLFDKMLQLEMDAESMVTNLKRKGDSRGALLALHELTRIVSLEALVLDRRERLDILSPQRVPIAEVVEFTKWMQQLVLKYVREPGDRAALAHDIREAMGQHMPTDQHPAAVPSRASQ